MLQKKRKKVLARQAEEEVEEKEAVGGAGLISVTDSFSSNNPGVNLHKHMNHKSKNILNKKRRKSALSAEIKLD